MKLSHLFQNMFSPSNNCVFATTLLIKLLSVEATNNTIQKDLEEHPSYQSILSISDVLSGVGIMNVVRGDVEINDFIKNNPVPFIAQIKIERTDYFTVVSFLDKESITYFHPITNKETICSLADFDKIFTGTVLIAEAKENAGQKDYAQHLQEEKRQNATKVLAAIAIPIFTILACLFTFVHWGLVSLTSIIFTLITLAGTIVGSLLLWYEIDQHNPLLQQICSAGKKTNCNAVLQSKASKIFGISWSVIGFTYFAGSLIALLVSGIDYLPVLFILSWVNVVALPYIAFSIYYQAEIAKQWCVLCLTVQVLLALQFITAFVGGLHALSRHAEFVSASLLVSTDTILTIILSFLIPFLVVSLLLPALRKAKESKQNKMELQRLKHNPQIFEALLAKQKAITESTEGLGISIGNPDAKYKLIKVCNPYCGPCAKAHPTIEALLENNPNVQVQIIFTANGEENDIKTPPVKHLLAIASKSIEERTKQALDDWYLAEKKDYAAFAQKYPMNGELKLQDNKVKAMSEWCSKMEIAATPTFFVNSYQLPEIYSVADLKYFLSV